MPAVMKAIDAMNAEEKVQTMEYLWASLETSSAEYTPPPWHDKELRRRQELYAAGKVPTYEWTEVRSRLMARRAAM